jgi:hypothetical protein
MRNGQCGFSGANVGFENANVGCKPRKDKKNPPSGGLKIAEFF